MNTELKIVMQNEVGSAIGNDAKSLCVVWKNEEEQNDEFANLIVDAGNTIQSCGLLPSELLKQNQEMREMLKRVRSYDICCYSDSWHKLLTDVINTIESINP